MILRRGHGNRPDCLRRNKPFSPTKRRKKEHAQTPGAVKFWLVDLGMAAKARPAVVLSIPFLDNERALYAIVPHTTATRGGRFEVVIDVPWLQPGAFDVQGQRNLPASVFMRRMGTLTQPQMAMILPSHPVVVGDHLVRKMFAGKGWGLRDGVWKNRNAKCKIVLGTPSKSCQTT